MLEALLTLFQELFFFSAYISQNNSFPDQLPPQEEKQLIARMIDGDEEARSKLIEHNLRLVAHIAKKYVGNGREMGDLISTGVLGLIKAVSSFKPGKGTMLGTYAARCIENEILMSMRSEKKHKGNLSISLPIGTDREGNEILLIEVLGTAAGEVPDIVALHLELEKLFVLIKKVLSAREQTVIELRYGLYNKVPMPQREVAAHLSISRSYVSRIEKKALQKLHAAMES